MVFPQAIGLAAMWDDELLDKMLSSGFGGNLLVEYTYLFSCIGLDSSMKKDVAKIKAKVGK